MTSRALLDLTVADVLLRFPGAAHILVNRGIACVGCPFAPFDTVADVARIYSLDPIELATALLHAESAATAKPAGVQS